jgi:hypothetical protein
MTPGATGWRDPILRHFSPEVAAAVRLTLVADPDHLLAEQVILEVIQRSGFEVVTFDDSVALRFAYESRYRRQWDQGRFTSLVVLLRSEGAEPDTLPYDLLKLARRYGRIHRFSIAEIFRDLSPRVLTRVAPLHYEGVANAVAVHKPANLGERGTKDFLLQHVFGWTMESIQTPVDLLRQLVRRHYRNEQLPQILDERLIERLEGPGRFEDWPLDRIIADRQAFFAFLQERWPTFVLRHVAGTPENEQTELQTNLTFPGPSNLPFDDPDVRVYIDNLFIEGYLTPVETVPSTEVQGTWLEWGVAAGTEEEAARRFQRLTEQLGDHVPGDTASYREWAQFSLRWAEWSALASETELGDDLLSTTTEVWATVNDQFGRWIQEHYSSLNNLAYLPTPPMVHHIVHYISHGWTPGSGARIALLVVDGLPMAQWLPLRRSLPGPGALEIKEDATFSWVPTITPVSRQAIFSGEAPFYFVQSIRSTAKDEAQWRRFWEGRGAHGHAVQFIAPRAKEPETELFERLMVAADHPGCEVIGGVVPTIDAMAHGAVTGTRGFHAQVAHWAADGHFRRIVDALVERGFTVYVTSDHGNLECTGIGKPNVGLLADERGERAHVFENDLVRTKTHEEYPGTILWPPIGLPEGYLPLLAAGRGAFVTKGQRRITHGGISLEEVVVPFVTIRSVE